MSFKIAFGNVAIIPVKFTLKEGNLNKLFSFTITANRVSQTDIQEASKTVNEFLLDNITDWSGQRLVLTESGEPAPFSKEALECMLNVLGVPGLLFQAYLRECGSKEKN